MPNPSSVQGYARQFTRSRRTPRTEARRGGSPPPPSPRAPEPLDEGGDDNEEAQEIDNAEVEAEDEDEGGDVVDITEEIEDDNGDGEEAAEEVPMEIDPPFDTTGLREIGNLASWTVSTCKPGCGVEALRDEDTNLFWQSDGPQPHHLNIHFSRLVAILSIRLHLDFEVDESYTPTRITLLAGTGYHDLLPFAVLEFSHPKGWIDVPLDGVGGGADGNALRAFLVQVKVVENHQNGKDTHIRGLKIYARDEKVGSGMGGMEALVEGAKGGHGLRLGEKEAEVDSSGDRAFGKVLFERSGFLNEPEWMGEPELR